MGLNYDPGFFYYYNKGVNVAPNAFYDNSSFCSNGFGLYVAHQLSEGFFAKMELSTIKQYQNIMEANSGLQTDTGKIYYYDTKYKYNFRTFNLPLMIGYRFEIVPDRDFYITASVGPQVTYIKDYNLERWQYITKNDQEGGTYISDELLYYTTMNSNKSYQILYEKGVTEDRPKVPYFYRNVTFGVIGVATLQKVFWDRWVVELGYRYEYDLTDPEKRPVGVYLPNSAVSPYPDGPRPHPTRFIRSGIRVSMGYVF